MCKNHCTMQQLVQAVVNPDGCCFQLIFKSRQIFFCFGVTQCYELLSVVSGFNKCVIPLWEERQQQRLGADCPNTTAQSMEQQNKPVV